MVVMQEVHYTTSTNKFKSMVIFYCMKNNARKTVCIVNHADGIQVKSRDANLNGVMILPQLEVSPAQFKWFTERYNEMKKSPEVICQPITVAKSTAI